MTALVWCPVPDKDEATRIAHALLDQKAIACANIIGSMTSVFEWQGERGTSEEFALLCKTDASRLDNTIKALEALHPYETPAIVGWKCDNASAATRDWIASVVAVEGHDATR